MCALFQSESCDLILYHGSTYVPVGTYHGTMVVRTYVRPYHGTYTCTTGTYVRTWFSVDKVRTYNVMSLSDWKRAHMCTECHVCFGRIHGSQLRERANAGQHTPTLSLPPSHHCLNGEVYRGNCHYKVCEHVGLDTNQSLHQPPERDVLGWYTCTYVRTYHTGTTNGTSRRVHYTKTT
jgi:hypothetical protein